MRKIATAAALVAAAPASAASGPFFSLANTNFIVLLGFLVFVGVLVYFMVPGLLMGMLDKRADSIRSELDEARALREEAQTLLAGYERKQREVQTQAQEIVEAAKSEAALSLEAAKADLEASVARRLQAAEEQIASAESSAIRSVRDQAVTVAVAAAGDVLAKQMSEEAAGKLIDDAISTVDAKLH